MTVPLPETDCRGVYFDGHSTDQMIAHAAAVSAADNSALRDRVRVLIEVVEGAAAVEEFLSNHAAIRRLAVLARAALKDTP